MTIARRDLLIGGACLAAAGASYALTPRQRLVLLKSGKIETKVPLAFGPWRKEEAKGVVVPRSEGSLSAKLYGETVTRAYQHAGTGAYVMLLIAYGATQNDELQLHRPEICYPAFGLEITSSRVATLDLGQGATVPIRELGTAGPDRSEFISYWTRVGEYLPTNGRDQRWAKLQNQLHGVVPDGALIRVSSAAEKPADAFALNQRFASDLLHAVAPSLLPVLVGSERARRLEAGRRAS